MNNDFRNQSIEIDKEKNYDFDQYRFPIEVDNFFYQLLSKDINHYSVEVQH